jgi:hypothetical protein
MLRDPVDSSTIAAIGYDDEREILEIEFVAGTVYRFLGVSEEVFDTFSRARSLGRFFNERIKDAYPSCLSL